MKITHQEMEYSIIETTAGYDVRDAGGTRPLGLRDVGPWTSEDAAVEAVLAMSAAECAE